ncbi:putative transcriptional regulatory protein C139,03 [Talaromyces islandicus]|uniref:Putative transcriptional regulatory protein C139,03 n=1 Tax=Talaromyces islandicus TaxID=28573 RepID=A0A0U1LVB3_TALIS|nr:putative transcriptional regulatory protein C139,03 [Talaromyces islandicus]
MEPQQVGDANGRGVRPVNAPIRGRPQLSCTPCKRRKLKCDRARPCDNCVKRREADTCVYPATGSVARDQTRESKKTKKRIERLESLVMELLDRGPQPNEALSDGPATSESDSQPQSHTYRSGAEADNDHDTDTSPVQPDIPPVRRPSSLPASTSSSSLWETVLQDIGEIKNYFEEHENDFKIQAGKVEDARNPPVEPYVLEGSPGQWNVDTFIPYVPPRPVVDILIAHYFGVDSHVRPIIHPKKFLREYEMFWQDQYSVSKLWLGLLFAIMRRAVHVARESGLDLTPHLGDTDEAITLFRMRTKQISLATMFTPPSIPKLELLAVHLDAEFTHSQDTSTDVWIDVATAVRMAMKLGLHRDPSLYGNLSPFECEMRRRLWLALVQTDVLISWQVGLPNMIVLKQCDTMLPRNLFEEDFDESTNHLPLSRPWNEVTKIGAFVVKWPLFEVFSKIASHVQDIHPNDAEVPILEKEIHAARDSLPPMYKVRSIQESILDSPAIILRRFTIDQTVHSGICVLHRRLFPLARTHPQYSHSRKAGIDAALTLLSYQALHYHETAPTGRLAGHKWMATSVVRHDYLLAAMLLCLDLRQGMTVTTHPASTDISLWGKDRREEMVAALETSYYVWRASKDTSIESFRASEAVAVLLNKVRSEESEKHMPESSTGSMPSVETLEISPPEFAVPNPDPYNLSLPFSEMVASPGAIDWAEFDRYVMGGNVPIDVESVYPSM